MKQIQEQEANGSYEVAYDCGNNTLKIVRVNVMGLGHRQSVLEIQRTGLDFLLENIEFENGLADTSHKVRRDSSSMFLVTDNPEDSEKKFLDELMTRYALEFRELFDSNERLRGYLESEFSQLRDYMK